jgi:hypothetical protein
MLTRWSPAAAELFVYVAPEPLIAILALKPPLYEAFAEATLTLLGQVTDRDTVPVPSVSVVRVKSMVETVAEIARPLCVPERIMFPLESRPLRVKSQVPGCNVTVAEARLEKVAMRVCVFPVRAP